MADDPWAAFREQATPSAGADDPWASFRQPPTAAEVTPGGSGGPARITVRPGQQQDPTAPDPSWGDIGTDVAASTAIGVPKGIIGMAGLPEAVAGYGASALGWLTGQDPETFRDQGAMRLPSTQQIRGAVEDVTGPLYEPKTGYGEFGQTVGEFIPAAALGPGGLARRLFGQALIPGVATEAAGQATGAIYPEAEPYVRGATALATGMRSVGKAERAAAEASRRQLLDVEMPAGTQALYNKVDQQTMNVPVPMMERSLLGQQMKYDLDRAGIRDISRSDGELPHKLAQNAAVDTRDVYDLVQWRRTMRDDLYGKGQARAANILTNAVDQTIDRIVPGAAADLRAANRENSIKELAKNLDERFQTIEEGTAAAHSGKNLDNKIRQSMIAFKKNQQDWHSLTPQEQLMVNSLIRGGVPQNTLRSVANLMGGGGGLGQLAAVYAAHAILGKTGAGAVAIASPALKGLQNVRSQDEVNRLLASVLGRSSVAPTSAADRLLAIPNWQRPGRAFYYGGVPGTLAPDANQ